MTHHDQFANRSTDLPRPTGKRFDADLLRRLRNEIPIDWCIRHAGWPCKQRNGKFQFVCPICNESDTAVNRRTNLARCFGCQRNYNPIEFTMTIRDWDFIQAVQYLLPCLRR